MSIQDPVSDMLTRIRNAQSARHRQVSMASSKLKVAIARLLHDEGYITSFDVDTTVPHQPRLSIVLKFFRQQPVIAHIKRISRPGLRVFRSYHDLPQVKGGLGVAVVSTPKGLMTDSQARERKLGGEVLCEVL